METVRIRLIFDNPQLLNHKQRKLGLDRSWIFLKPQHDTISDLSSYILSSFQLHEACPNGLILSMDGFVLPPFESTCILRDKDIIQVKKKGSKSADIHGLGNGENVEEVDGRQVADTGVMLLANEKFEKESGGYESEPEEDEPAQVEETLHVYDPPERKKVSKKRKATKVLSSTRKKKTKSTTKEQCPSVHGLDNVENVEEVDRRQVADTGVMLLANVEFEKDSGGYESKPEGDEPGQVEETLHVYDKPERKKVSKKRKATKVLGCTRKRKTKSSTTEQFPSVTESVQKCHAEHKGRIHPIKGLALKNKSPNRDAEPGEISSSDSDGKPTTIAERPSQLQNGTRIPDVSDTDGGNKKTSSRSARRRKAKRRWLREKAEAEKKELQKQLLNEGTQPAANVNDVKSSENQVEQQPDEDDDGGDVDDDDIVPVVIRPGHIRFQHVGKVAADQVVEQNQNHADTLLWNGITSKKRGQKWGIEKGISHEKNDYKDIESETPTVLNFESEISSKLTAEPEAPANGSIYFESLSFYTSLPKQGDTIAYRLIELSSSWTPEMSSFRVGEVAWHDSESNRIMLISVPEYPIVIKNEIDEESATQQDTSLYGEDGSLKIDYSALVDVRIVKPGNLDSSKAETDSVEEALIQSNGLGLKPHNNNWEGHAMTQENGEVNAWDEIGKALSAKKVQLAGEGDRNRPESSGRSSGSYRGLRSGALGRTLALLRAQNEL